MSNVVERNIHLQHQRARSSAVSRAAVVADLVTLSAGIQDVAEKTLDLTSPSLLQLEYAVQHLVDAFRSLEAATKVLTDDGDWVSLEGVRDLSSIGDLERLHDSWWRSSVCLERRLPSASATSPSPFLSVFSGFW